jgi:hypothetical protein
MNVLGAMTPESSGDADEVSPAKEVSRGRHSHLLGGHFWPLIAMVAILITGMAYSFWWPQIWYHVDVWATPGDLWSTFRDAHWIGWGSEGAIYGTKTGLVTFPGIAVLLTPLAMLQNPLHLTASYPVFLPKPTEWYLLGPVELLLGGFVLFPLNILATRLEISARRRILLVWIEAALAWPVVAIWGHPEDSIAVALTIYALVAVYDNKLLHAGFFLGLAVAFQPLVLLAIPVVFALIPLRRWPLLIGEITLPSAVLLLGPLLHDWGPTTRALLKQPNYPQLNHPTPWLALAPKLSPTHYVNSYVYHERTLVNGTKVYTETPKKILTGTVVAAGPEREVSLVLALCIGIYVFRKTKSWPALIWWIGVALSLRCVFESILDPFYLYPGVAFLIVASFTTSWRKISLTLLFGACCSLVSYWHTGEWTYYLLVTASLLFTCVAAYPTTSHAWSSRKRTAVEATRLHGTA